MSNLPARHLNRLFIIAGSASLLLLSVSAVRLHGTPAREVDWPAYGGGPEGMRYSKLAQVNRSNVSRLRVAWQYDTAEGPGDSQTQPIMVDGVVFGVTPSHKAIALDAATGALLWTFD